MACTFGVTGEKSQGAYGLGKGYGVYAGWEGFDEWELGNDLEILGRRLFVTLPNHRR